MPSNFFLIRGGQPFGPYNINQLKLAISQGKLKQDDILSSEAGKAGRPARQIPELSNLFGPASGAVPAIPSLPPQAQAPQSANSMQGITNAYWLNSDAESQPARRLPQVDSDAAKKPFKLDPVMMIGGGLLAVGAIGSLIGVIFFSVFGAKAWNDMQEETRRNVGSIASGISSDLNTITTGQGPSHSQAPQRASAEAPPARRPPSDSGPTIKTFRLEVGKATFRLQKNGWNELKVECNNGLIAETRWRPNPADEFGYDIAEPTVNQTTNRLAVMILLRGIIANYMNGKYD